MFNKKTQLLDLSTLAPKYFGKSYIYIISFMNKVLNDQKVGSSLTNELEYVAYESAKEIWFDKLKAEYDNPHLYQMFKEETVAYYEDDIFFQTFYSLPDSTAEVNVLDSERTDKVAALATKNSLLPPVLSAYHLSAEQFEKFLAFGEFTKERELPQVSYDAFGNKVEYFPNPEGKEDSRDSDPRNENSMDIVFKIFPEQCRESNFFLLAEVVKAVLRELSKGAHYGNDLGFDVLVCHKYCIMVLEELSTFFHSFDKKYHRNNDGDANFSAMLKEVDRELKNYRDALVLERAHFDEREDRIERALADAKKAKLEAQAKELSAVKAQATEADKDEDASTSQDEEVRYFRTVQGKIPLPKQVLSKEEKEALTKEIDKTLARETQLKVNKEIPSYEAELVFPAA